MTLEHLKKNTNYKVKLRFGQIIPNIHVNLPLKKPSGTNSSNEFSHGAHHIIFYSKNYLAAVQCQQWAAANYHSEKDSLGRS